LHQRPHDVADRRLLQRVEPPDGAEVDEPNTAVDEDEDVAWMGIGVEHPARST
jgi:hypothetical protein